MNRHYAIDLFMSIQMPLPKGWRKERIKLPPSFAPKMKWKRHKDLRFAVARRVKN